MSKQSWVEFWREHGDRLAASDAQTQVLRTSGGRPIDPARWQFTLNEIDRVFPVGIDDDLLDLCCGNGLFSTHFSAKCRSVLAVDVSATLLAALEPIAPNVQTRCADARDLDCVEGQFSRIFFYAGVQYFDLRETVLLFRKFARWLRPGGVLFAGDIPDQGCIWSFYNTPERRKLYFDNLVAGRDVVGTWFAADWLVQLATACGFRSAIVVPQHPDLIYAHFRYDFLATR